MSKPENPQQVEVSTVALASATTGYLLCDIGEVYQVIEQMTGVPPFTHQLPRMGHELAGHVHRVRPDFPTKAEAEAFPVNSETHAAYAAEIIARFGETITLPCQTIEARDPIAEAVDMVGPDRVVVLTARQKDTP